MSEKEQNKQKKLIRFYDNKMIIDMIPIDDFEELEITMSKHSQTMGYNSRYARVQVKLSTNKKLWEASDAKDD